MFFTNIFDFNSFLILFITFIVGLYFYSKRKFNYWKSRGIDGPRPIPLLGTFYQIFFASIQQNNLQNTKKYGKVYGGYLGYTPALMIADPEMIKNICIKDFNVFVDRNQFLTGDPLSDKFLFNLMGDEWRRVRSIISPTFSSGKMRRMHPIIVDCVQRLEDHLDKIVLDQQNEIELKQITSKLTMDVIVTCAFGTRIDVYNEEKAEPFIENAKIIIKPGLKMLFRFLLMTTFPGLSRFGWRTFGSSEVAFFTSAFNTIVERRKSENREYNDYLQLMLNAINKTNESEEQDIELDKSHQIFGHTNENFKNVNRVITEEELFANAFQFLLVGYETSASFLSFFFYLLALNEKCQQKLYEEIKQFNGEFNYESIAQMPYLEACVAETLRLYNPVPTLERESSEDYILGDSGVTIPKGMKVGFDVETIHHSPEYYPDPGKWDPERFMPENRDKLIPYTYMPFGIGPRNCVGMRFALMESKTAIAYLVHRFEFTRTPNTKPLTKPKKYNFHRYYGDLNVSIKYRDV